MKKEQTPIAIGLVVVILVAVAFVFMRSRQPTDASASLNLSTPAPVTGGAPTAKPATGYAAPGDEAKTKGQFTPAPR